MLNCLKSLKILSKVEKTIGANESIVNSDSFFHSAATWPPPLRGGSQVIENQKEVSEMTIDQVTTLVSQDFDGILRPLSH